MSNPWDMLDQQASRGRARVVAKTSAPSSGASSFKGASSLTRSGRSIRSRDAPTKMSTTKIASLDDTQATSLTAFRKISMVDSAFLTDGVTAICINARTIYLSLKSGKIAILHENEVKKGMSRGCTKMKTTIDFKKAKKFRQMAVCSRYNVLIAVLSDGHYLAMDTKKLPASSDLVPKGVTRNAAAIYNDFNESGTSLSSTTNMWAIASRKHIFIFDWDRTSNRFVNTREITTSDSCIAAVFVCKVAIKKSDSGSASVSGGSRFTKKNYFYYCSHKVGYIQYDLDSGTERILDVPRMDVKPYICKVEYSKDDERSHTRGVGNTCYLLCHSIGNVGIFLDSQGQMATINPVNWSSNPIYIVECNNYLLGYLSNHTIEVISLVDGKLMQSMETPFGSSRAASVADGFERSSSMMGDIGDSKKLARFGFGKKAQSSAIGSSGFDDSSSDATGLSILSGDDSTSHSRFAFRGLSSDRGYAFGMFVTSTAHAVIYDEKNVLSYIPTETESQIDECIESLRIEKAIQLLMKTEPTLEQLRDLHSRAAFRLFETMYFKRAFEHFKESDVDCRDIIYLFPSVKPDNYMYSIQHESAPNKTVHSIISDVHHFRRRKQTEIDGGSSRSALSSRSDRMRTMDKDDLAVDAAYLKALHFLGSYLWDVRCNAQLQRGHAAEIDAVMEDIVQFSSDEDDIVGGKIVTMKTRGKRGAITALDDDSVPPNMRIDRDTLITIDTSLVKIYAEIFKVGAIFKQTSDSTSTSGGGVGLVDSRKMAIEEELLRSPFKIDDLFSRTFQNICYLKECEDILIANNLYYALALLYYSKAYEEYNSEDGSGTTDVSGITRVGSMLDGDPDSVFKGASSSSSSSSSSDSFGLSSALSPPTDLRQKFLGRSLQVLRNLGRGKFRDVADETCDGIDLSVLILREMEDSMNLWSSVKWVLRKAPEKGMEVFTVAHSISGRKVKLDDDKILKFLRDVMNQMDEDDEDEEELDDYSDVSSDVAALLKKQKGRGHGMSMSTTATRARTNMASHFFDYYQYYLEHLVNTVRTQDPKYHNNLGLTYMKNVDSMREAHRIHVSMDSVRSTMATGVIKPISRFKSPSSIRESPDIAMLRRKLVDFLKNSRLYDALLLLEKALEYGLDEETLQLNIRLERHNDVLRVLTMEMNDKSRAIEYCLDGQPPSQRFIVLVQLEIERVLRLDAQRSVLSDTRIGTGFSRSPSPSPSPKPPSKKQDIEDEDIVNFTDSDEEVNPLGKPTPSAGAAAASSSSSKKTVKSEDEDDDEFLNDEESKWFDLSGILESYGHLMDMVEILKILPASIPVSCLFKYFRKQIPNIKHERKTTAVKSNLVRTKYRKTQLKYTAMKCLSIRLARNSQCGVCGKDFSAQSIFVASKDLKRSFHYSCFPHSAGSKGEFDIVTVTALEDERKPMSSGVATAASMGNPSVSASMGGSVTPGSVAAGLHELSHGVSMVSHLDSVDMFGDVFVPYESSRNLNFSSTSVGGSSTALTGFQTPHADHNPMGVDLSVIPKKPVRSSTTSGYD